MKIYHALAAFLIISSCSQFQKQDSQLPEDLDDAVSSSLRSEENTDRDKFQHPKETLKFFGIRHDMTVVEISPGAGYYTEILAPYLAKEGQLYLAVPRLPPRPPRVLIENERKLQDILLRYREVQANTKLIPFEPIDKRNKTKEAFADLVITFNNIHNLVAKKTADESFKFFFDILKPGGTLGVVQHRVKANKRKVPKSGYMYEEEIISLARAAGFRFSGKSEVNANSKDTADYPQGVWVLPPTYRLGDVNRDKYEDIGESDRMTLKFVKP